MLGVIERLKFSLEEESSCFIVDSNVDSAEDTVSKMVDIQGDNVKRAAIGNP